MLAFHFIGLVLWLAYAQLANALDGKDILPPEQAFQLSVNPQANDKLAIQLKIADGYHLYRDKFKFQSQTDAIQLGEINLPTGTVEHDASFGDVVVYRGLLQFSVPLVNESKQTQLKFYIKYQGCADIGLCYPPQKQILELTLPEANQHTLLKKAVQGLQNLLPGATQQDLLPPEQAFQFFANVKDDHTVHVSWIAANGYFMYKNKLGITLESPSQDQIGKYLLPEGEGYFDPEFGQVEIYRQEVSADVPLHRTGQQAETIIITGKFQGCADRGVCYPPMQTSVNLELPVAETINTATTQITPAAKPLQNTVVNEQDKIVTALKQDGLLMTLLSFFGFGVLLAFTPCVFPMIPILSGIIVGQGNNISTRKGFLLSLSYVLASASMYTLFGVLAALFGNNLQAAFQDPWVIATFSGLFVLLSLSMFGFYDLQLPASLQARLATSSNQHSNGSYIGAAIMGALSALIVGPCVAAPLAAALIYIGQTGDVLLGGSALFFMGLGMGLPLLLLGASAGKLLPKSGAWLNSTKIAFGVIMLGVALWMLSRILPSATTMFLTALILIVPAVFLGALEPLPNNASGWKTLCKGLGLVLLIIGVLELIGLAAGNYTILQPLGKFSSTGNNQNTSKQGLTFTRVTTLAQLDNTLAQAKAKQQAVMLDFYAEWCVSCKEMEEYTFTDSKVQQQLSGVLLLQADVTENNDDDKALLQRFKLVGPPGIIFFDKDGVELTSSRVIGYQDANGFLQTLQLTFN